MVGVVGVVAMANGATRIWMAAACFAFVAVTPNVAGAQGAAVPPPAVAPGAPAVVPPAVLPGAGGAPARTDALIALKPIALTWPGGAEPAKARVILQNAGDKPFKFNPPLIMAFTDGGGEVATTIAPDLKKGTCPNNELKPAGLCQYLLTIPRQLSPGDYTLKIAATGVDGGIATQDVSIKVKATWLAAFAVFVVGALGGWLVTEWRSRGRNAVGQLTRLARLREKADELLRRAGASELKPAIQAFRGSVDAVEIALREGKDQAAAVDALRERIDMLAEACAAAETVRSMNAPLVSGILQPRLDELITAYGLRTDADAGARAALDALTADLRTIPALIAAHRLAEALVETLVIATGAPRPDDEEALAKALTRLAAGDTVATRTATLTTLGTQLRSEADAALKKWRKALDDKITALASTATPNDLQRLNDLKSELTAAAVAPPLDQAKKLQAVEKEVPTRARRAAARTVTTTAQSATANIELPRTGPGLDFGLGFSLLPPSGLAAAELERRQRRWEFGTNLFALALIGLGGVSALWLPDDTWGSFGDVLTALLAGAAVRAAAGDALTGTART